MNHPLVSVVIPTRNRPELLVRAVTSALLQTFRQLEVIVVVDGPDEVSVRACDAIRDERLNVVALPRNVGGAQARNLGVKYAAGQWIAFLDDDDIWDPRKIEEQLTCIDLGTNFVACKALVCGRGHQVTMPVRFPKSGETIGDYLFCRSTLRQKHFLQTSTFMIRRDLLIAVPFRAGLRKHQDWDWLLRVSASGSLSPVYRNQALVTYFKDTAGSVSRSGDWTGSLQWAREHCEAGRLSKRAYSYFLATQCVSRIQCNLQARLPIVARLARMFFVDGQPTFAASLLFIGFSLRGNKYESS